MPPTLIATWLSALMMRSPPTVVSVAQGQLFPGTGEVTALTSRLLPVSGSFTVAVYVIVTPAPGARSPLHVRIGDVKVTVPAVALTLEIAASSTTSVRVSLRLAGASGT